MDHGDGTSVVMVSRVFSRHDGRTAKHPINPALRTFRWLANQQVCPAEAPFPPYLVLHTDACTRAARTHPRHLPVQCRTVSYLLHHLGDAGACRLPYGVVVGAALGCV